MDLWRRTCERRGSALVAQLGLFDVHVLEFTGLKDIAAFDALNELGVILPRHNLNAGMLARARVLLFVGWR